MTQQTDPGLQALERQIKATVTVLRSIQADARAAAQALTGIHGALVEANRARDRWAREISAILGDAKGET